MPARSPDVPRDIIAKLRLVCLDLPEVQEEVAWVGTRWTVRKKNFAHVLTIDEGYPPAYASAAGCSGPACVLTLRSARPAREVRRYEKHPFFRPVWWENIVGMFLDSTTDWDDVGVLLIESYCVLAPQRLVKLVDRPR